MQGAIIMNNETLNELKMDIYELYGKNRGKKVMKVYRRMLAVIAHAEELNRIVSELRRIGSKHSL
jgi:hypothetical protein